MDTIPVVLPVQEDFWQALDNEDLTSAGAYVQEALTEGDYSEKGMLVYQSVLYKHLWKYVTGFRTSLSEDSVEFTFIEIDESKLKGTVTLNFHVSAYLGCKDMDIEEDLDAEIDFTIDREYKVVMVHFVEDSLRSNEDAEWAE